MRIAHLLLLLFAMAWPVWPALATDAEHACDAAAARAEREMGVPSGVLAAVGVVESGRLNRGGGAAPWPWTINAAGKGAHYASKPEAVGAVLTQMARGIPLIDVGCFQIDILYHAGVFSSLDEAFDPDRNAQEAARILLAERAAGADWPTAVARYHSANPLFGMPYLQRVRAALPASRLRANAADLFRSLGDATAFAHPESATLISVPSAALFLPRVIYALPTSEVSESPRVRQREIHSGVVLAAPARSTARPMR